MARDCAGGHSFLRPSNDRRSNVLYHYPFIGDRLVIGKFCAIARGVRFIMNGANHKLSGVSTYPFQIFGVKIGNGAIVSSRSVVVSEVIVSGDVERLRACAP